MNQEKDMYHRKGEPGGAGCPVGIMSIQFKDAQGQAQSGFLLDAGKESSEVELLRTVAAKLCVRWGKDDLGWWAVVCADDFPSWAVWRQDDNNNEFLVEANLTEQQAKALVRHYEHLGHKQMYWARDEKCT